MFSEKDKISLTKPLVALLSTGLDSPIACYLMMKQGHDILSLSFLNGGINSKINKEKVLKVGQRLVELTGRTIRMHFVDYDQYLEKFIDACERRLTCIFCKRTMIYIASSLAEFYNAIGIINGDILGEQASQTLDNLYVVHQINLKIPVIRPLIGFDKLDVIRISRYTGLYDISLMEGVSCDKNPKYPETHANLNEVLKNEEKIDREQILQHMMKNIEYITLVKH